MIFIGMAIAAALLLAFFIWAAGKVFGIFE